MNPKQNETASLKHFFVNGKFLIPDSRRVNVYFGRVIAKDLDAAVKSVAPIVSRQVRHHVSPLFCRLNLRFTVVG